MIYRARFQEELVDPEEFLALSAEMNYQLSARNLNERALLALIMGPRLRDQNTEPLLEALQVLLIGYEDIFRNLGPKAILHPLRTTALLARVMPEPTVLDLLCALLHDKEEDLYEKKLGSERFARMQARYSRLQDQIDRDQRWFLGERLGLLTCRKGEWYNAYLGRILNKAKVMPDLLHVKIADRLDNSLDVTVARPGVLRYDLFQNIFSALFVPKYQGVKIEEYHFLPLERDGVQILSNLFKNILFISLLRKAGLERVDRTTAMLSEALCMASSKVGQWLVLEVFASCITDGDDQRKLLEDVREYCASGGIEAIRTDDNPHPLDGIFLKTYGLTKEGRSARLAALWENKKEVARVVLVFIAVFTSFQVDPNYYVKGIDQERVFAVEDDRV